MNNVVIDDRRIQVDFSQSVSKLLHRNNKPGIMTAKPKYGEPPSRTRELLPKAFTEGKDKTQKYDLVIPNTQSRPKEERKERSANEPERKEHTHSEKKRERSREKERKRKDSRSRSNSHKKHKKRSGSS